MNWKDIKVSGDCRRFLFEDRPLFGKTFVEVLKFHSPGLAPVTDETGSYHIDIQGRALYPERYGRTFGFYCNRASVVKAGKWFHIDEKGQKPYDTTYAWTGNYQEDKCVVRDEDNRYFHIDLFGNRTYSNSYVYAGDYKDDIACVKMADGRYRHIDANGNFINGKSFLDLGVFHKKFATAKDNGGWFHIDKSGNALYKERYLMIEPFYNGFALVKDSAGSHIIDETGKTILNL